MRKYQSLKTPHIEKVGHECPTHTSIFAGETPAPHNSIRFTNDCDLTH
jgi:hypothetical protein